MEAYPNAQAEVDVDETLLRGAPRVWSGVRPEPVAERTGSADQPKRRSEAAEAARPTIKASAENAAADRDSAASTAAPASPPATPLPPDVELEAYTDTQLAKRASHRLALTLPVREPYLMQVKELCAGSPGDVPVYVRIADEGITLLMERAYWPRGDGAMLASLRAMLGDENVTLR